MAFTFGAATGDDITWTESASPWGATARSGLIAGWFLPTTLTATRTLWSVGATNRCAIATTTSEVDVFVQRTTNSQYTTSGLGLTAGRWHFLAILASWSNTGPTDTYRVWRGYDVEVPSLVTINQTAPAGAGTSTSSTIPSIGNAAAAGTVAFQGDVGRFDFIVGTVNNAFCNNTTGAISADDETVIFNTVVMPLWCGEVPTFHATSAQGNNGITHISVDLDQAGGYARSVRNGGSIYTMDRALTVSGATASLNRSPIMNVMTMGAQGFRPVRR